MQSTFHANVGIPLLRKTVFVSRPGRVQHLISPASVRKYTSTNRLLHGDGMVVRCVVASALNDDTTPRAQEGDIVTIHWSCLNEQGEVLETSKTADEPTTFEVGAGDIVGNQLFEAFDEAVRGLSVGESLGIKADGGEWKEELLFQVPRDHPEVQRMEGRYKNQGGVQKGLLAELSNGGLALVIECTDDLVTLDANSMMAGKTLVFELELLNIDRPTVV